MNLHPSLTSLLKFQDKSILCPFCCSKMRDYPGKDYWKCENCTHDLIIHPTIITYDFIIKKNIKVIVSADFNIPQTSIITWTGFDLDLQVPHTKFPFFNIQAMRHKIKNLLPFI